MADLTQAVSAGAGQAKAEVKHFAFAGTQVVHQVVESFLAFVVIPQDVRVVIRHCLGELEIAVVIKNGIQADRCAEVAVCKWCKVFQTAAGAFGQFLQELGRCLPP